MKKIFKEPLLYLLFMLAASWFFMIHENANIGLRHFAFIVVLLTCVFLLLQKFRFGFRASFVVILGIAIRIIFYSNTTAEEFNYDLGPHMIYINVLAQDMRIPSNYECFVCYHPPLYYIIAAPASYDFNVLRQVQMLFSFLTLAFGVALIYRLLGKNMTGVFNEFALGIMARVYT